MCRLECYIQIVDFLADLFASFANSERILGNFGGRLAPLAVLRLNFQYTVNFTHNMVDADSPRAAAGDDHHHEDGEILEDGEVEPRVDDLRHDGDKHRRSGAANEEDEDVAGDHRHRRRHLPRSRSRSPPSPHPLSRPPPSSARYNGGGGGDSRRYGRSRTPPPKRKRSVSRDRGERERGRGGGRWEDDRDYGRRRRERRDRSPLERERGNDKKEREEEEDDEEFQARVAASLAAQEEDEDKIIEERRRRRQEILAKYKKNGNRTETRMPTAVAVQEQKEVDEKEASEEQPVLKGDAVDIDDEKGMQEQLGVEEGGVLNIWRLEGDGRKVEAGTGALLADNDGMGEEWGSEAELRLQLHNAAHLQEEQQEEKKEESSPSSSAGGGGGYVCRNP